jgi:predicted TIM-barrel fold metal-dependent hydrolase
VFVFDNHVHLSRVGEHVSPFVLKELRRPNAQRAFRYHEDTSGASERRDPAGLVELMDQSGIDACLVMAAMWSRVLTPEQRPLHIPNELVMEAIEHDPRRFVGMASADPIPDPFAAADEIEQCLRQGFKAIKLLPTYAHFDPRDRRCDPIYEVACSFDVPVHFHMGWSPVCTSNIEFQRPWLLDEVGNRFPGLKVVICHMAWPYWEEAIGLVARHENFYADVSALGFWHPEKLYRMIHDFGCLNSFERLLYGSENPFMATLHKTVADINTTARHFSLPEIPEEDLVNILGGNAVRLYKLNVSSLGRPVGRDKRTSTG